MKQNQIILTYTILLLTLIGSSVVLAFQIRDYMNNRDYDPTAKYQNQVVNPDDVIEQRNEEAIIDQRENNLTFSKTKAFVALAKWKAKPTPTPKPEPTPTPVVPGKNWKIVMAMGNMVILRNHKNEDFTKKVGEVCSDPVNGDFKILSVESKGFDDQRVKIQHVASGTTGYITTMVQ